MSLDFRIATLNISGGEKTYEPIPNDSTQGRQEALMLLIKQMNADVLCLQEVSQYVDADGVTHSPLEAINAFVSDPVIVLIESKTRDLSAARSLR